MIINTAGNSETRSEENYRKILFANFSVVACSISRRVFFPDFFTISLTSQRDGIARTSTTFPTVAKIGLAPNCQLLKCLMISLVYGGRSTVRCSNSLTALRIKKLDTPLLPSWQKQYNRSSMSESGRDWMISIPIRRVSSGIVSANNSSFSLSGNYIVKLGGLSSSSSLILPKC